MIIDDIDFAEMYRTHITLASRRPKPPEDWDKRAEDMAKSCGDAHNPYVAAFVGKMDLAGAETLLDVGCGPGTICLPLAHQMKRLYALDYSKGMLNVLERRAREEYLNNVQTILKSWDDDWSDVPQCDIVVASRATMVGDIEKALRKISSKAKKAVYTTFTVDKHFIDPTVAECLNKKTVGFPNYLYAVNVLDRIGYLPCVDYIATVVYKKPPSGFDAFMRNILWSVGEVDEEETARLKQYYERHLDDGQPPQPFMKTWAFVYWRVDQERRV